MPQPREEQIVFMVSGDQEKVVPGVTGVAKYLVLGVPKAAWRYMHNGKTHTFDLRRMGLPTQLIIFGGETRAHVMDLLSLMTGPVPKVADMYTDNAIPQDERVLPKIHAAARAYELDNGERPLAHLTEEELQRLIETMLKAPELR